MPRRGHWPETPYHRPGGGQAGVGHRAHYPYAYVGYPGLLSYGYGLPLAYGAPYGSDLEDTGPAQAEPQPPDYGDGPNGPLDDIHPEVAENASSAFRPPYQEATQEAPVHAQPATTLVFNDGRPSMQVHNYALTGSTLYALDGETRQEIPLSVLNVPATVEANRKTGVDFALPVSH